MRNTLALRIPLNGEPEVETVTDQDGDIDSCDQVYADEHQDDDIPSDTNIYDLMDDGWSICRSPFGHFPRNGICVHCGDPVPGSGGFRCGGV